MSFELALEAVKSARKPAAGVGLVVEATEGLVVPDGLGAALKGVEHAASSTARAGKTDWSRMRSFRLRRL
jgi:hypothetical protein